MANIQQIQNGLTKFIDNHIAGSFSGWQKAVVVGGAVLITANLPKLIKEYSSHPIVSAIGVYDPETGNLDVDALYNAFVPHLGVEKIPVTIPKIGTIKMGREDIDVLIKCIREA